MPYVVISCPGAMTTYDPSNFGGRPFESPNTYITGEPSWDNGLLGLNNSSATADMDRLYTLIYNNRNNLDGIRVFGHSRGGQIIYKLFRERMAELVANINPERILFVSSGNPERKFNGVSWLRPDYRKPVYPGPDVGGPGVGYGLPPSGVAPFTLIDISRQYDEWADYPNDWSNTAATQRIGSANVHSAYAGAAHLGADGWPLDWDDWARFDDPGTNVIYLTSPAAASVTAPPKTFLQTVHGGEYLQHRVADARHIAVANAASVESAYTRPVPVYPKVTVAA